MDSSIFPHFARIILKKKIVIPWRLHIFNQHHQAEQLQQCSQSHAQQMQSVTLSLPSLVTAEHFSKLSVYNLIGPTHNNCSRVFSCKVIIKGSFRVII